MRLSFKFDRVCRRLMNPHYAVMSRDRKMESAIALDFFGNHFEMALVASILDSQSLEKVDWVGKKPCLLWLFAADNGIPMV